MNALSQNCNGFEAKLNDLAMENPIVHSYMRHYVNGRMTLECALCGMVLDLAKDNKALFKIATELQEHTTQLPDFIRQLKP